LRVEGNKIYREKGSKKVKKNGEKCQYFFFHEKAKLVSSNGESKQEEAGTNYISNGL